MQPLRASGSDRPDGTPSVPQLTLRTVALRCLAISIGVQTLKLRIAPGDLAERRRAARSYHEVR